MLSKPNATGGGIQTVRFPITPRSLQTKRSGRRVSDNINYEYKSMHVVRGMEKRSIAKAQKEGGWELVDQTQSALRTTLNYRRVKPETFVSKVWHTFRGLAPAKQKAFAATAAVFLLLAAGGIGMAAALDEGATTAERPAAETTKPTQANKTSTSPPSPIPSEEVDRVITTENNKDLAALLKTGDYCDPSVARFAAKYQDKKIEFDGSVANVEPHGNYETRYDILLYPGNAGPNATTGPAFKYEDVNMSDLGFAGKTIPAQVAAGDKFRFTAEVGTYNPDQCLFNLTPVSTAGR